MNIAQLKRLLKAGESEKIEFKSSFCKEVIESVSAFANTKGGNTKCNQRISYDEI